MQLIESSSGHQKPQVHKKSFGQIFTLLISTSHHTV